MAFAASATNFSSQQHIRMRVPTEYAILAQVAARNDSILGVLIEVYDGWVR